MIWQDTRVQTVAPQKRETITPSNMEASLVEHYSIVALEDTGKPDLVPPETIMSNKQSLRGGEVLVSRLNPRKSRVLRVPELTEYPAVASSEFIALNPTAIEDDYLVYILLSEEVRQYLNSRVQSVTRSHQRIRPEHLLKLQIRIPERMTQCSVSQYLDRETGKIDDLVEQKRLLLERLAEYRAALITRTVTGSLQVQAARDTGIKPAQRYKHSGVDWLGDIPEHWEIVRLKTLASYRTSSVDKKSIDSEQPVRLCNYTDVYYLDTIRVSDGDHMKATASCAEISRFGLCKGDVVVTKDSEDWQDIGIPALIEESAIDFVCGYHLGIIRAGTSACPGFLFRVIQSDAFNWQMQVRATGVTRYGIPVSAVTEAIITLPPLEEQQAISEYLDVQTARIDRLSSLVQEAIERLEEYRSALVTAAVTGKIDVRNMKLETTKRVGG